MPPAVIFSWPPSFSRCTFAGIMTMKGPLGAFSTCSRTPHDLERDRCHNYTDAVPPAPAGPGLYGGRQPVSFERAVAGAIVKT